MYFLKANERVFIVPDESIELINKITIVNQKSFGNAFFGDSGEEYGIIIDYFEEDFFKIDNSSITKIFDIHHETKYLKNEIILEFEDKIIRDIFLKEHKICPEENIDEYIFEVINDKKLLKGVNSKKVVLGICE